MTVNKAKKGAGRPSAEEAESKRRNLLEAALNEFAEVGFHRASARDIAHRAGVSTRTLYNHYADKSALFEACLDMNSQMMMPSTEWEEGDLATRLFHYTVALHKQHWTDRARKIGRLIYREASVFDDVREITRQQFERFQVGPVVTILRQAGFREEDCRRLATYFVVMALGEWQRSILFDAPPLAPEEFESQARDVVRVFLLGALAQARALSI